MTAESDWLTIRNNIQEDAQALLDLGIPIDTARRLVNWSPLYEFTDYSDVTANQSNPIPESAPRTPANRLWVSLSEKRWSPTPLHESVLDSSKEYAIYIKDAPDAGITKIDFYLDDVHTHFELSEPWDYIGTKGNGDANKVSFSSGFHTIRAEIEDSFGSWEVQAMFEVQ